jgi:hypothetical protein
MLAAIPPRFVVRQRSTVMSPSANVGPMLAAPARVSVSDGGKKLLCCGTRMGSFLAPAP